MVHKLKFKAADYKERKKIEQSILLARTLLRNNDILIMDEATSSMDNESAIEIYQYILNTVKTVIIVDHNLPSSITRLIDQKIEI